MSLVDILATASLSDARASCAHDAICVVTERLLGLLQQPMLSTSLTVVAQQAAQQEPPPPPTAPHANGDDDGHCHRGRVTQQPPNARARLLRAVTRLYLRLVQAGGADDEVASDDGDGRGGSSNNRSGAVIAEFMRCDDVVNAVLFDGPFCLSIEEYWETQQQLRDEAITTRDGVAVPEKRGGDCMARSLERMLRCLGPAAARRVVLGSRASSPRRSLWCRHLWETLRCAAPIVVPRPVAATSSVVTGAVAQERRAVRRTYASLWAPLVLCQLLLADARDVVTVDQLLSHSAPQSSITEEEMGAGCAHHAPQEHFWTRLAAPFSGALRCWCKTPTTSVHASPIAAPLYVPVDAEDIGPLAPHYVSTPDDVDALQEALLDATIASLAEVPCAPRCCGGDRGAVVADEDVLQGTQASAEALLCMFYNDTDSMEGQVVQYALQRPDALILERPGVFDRFDADHHPNSRHPRLPGGPMPSLPLPASAALSTDVAQIGMLLAAFPDRLWGEEVGQLLEAGGGTSPAAPMPEGDVAAVAASVIASTGWRAFAVVHSADAVAFPSTQQFRGGGAVSSSATTTARRVLTLRKPIAATATDRSEMTMDPPPCTAMEVIMSESFVCAVVRCVAALGAEQASLSGALRRLHHAAASGGGLAADGLIFQSPGGTDATAGATTAATSQKRMSIVAAPPLFLAAMLGRMPHRSAPRAAAYADMRDNAHESTRGHVPIVGVDAKDDALPPPPPVGSHFCAVVLSLAVLRYAVQLCAAVAVWCPQSQGLITVSQRRVNKLKGCQDSSSSNGTQPPTTQLAAVAPMCIACLTKTMQFCPGWFLCEFGLDGLVPMLRAMMDALWLEAQAAPDDGAVTVDGTARSLVMHILGDMIQWLTTAPHQ